MFCLPLPLTFWISSSWFLQFKTSPHLVPFPPAASAQGPTLTARIKGYSLVRDVASSLQRPRMPPNAFKSAPLVVLNGFQVRARPGQPGPQQHAEPRAHMSLGRHVPLAAVT
jgi:hypothetical protein